MTVLEVMDVVEEWQDGSIVRVEVEIAHAGNQKTFTFERQDTFTRLTPREARSPIGKVIRFISRFTYDPQLKFRRMSMKEDATSYTWGEEEVETMADAYKLARETAFERAGLDDSLSLDAGAALESVDV